MINHITDNIYSLIEKTFVFPDRSTAGQTIQFINLFILLYYFFKIKCDILRPNINKKISKYLSKQNIMINYL